MPTLLSAADRHLVGRFSYGVTPELARDVRRAGGGRAWFEQQLSPGAVRDGAADRLRGWWPSLDRGPTELWKRQDQEIEGGWEVMADYQRWVLMRRMRSRRQLHEVMTELWEHHFNVPVNGDAQFTWRCDYGNVIRKHALGRFDELLVDVATHPALLISLDNVSSSKEFPNENLGRELLELHTVGRGAYTERDVKDSARIFTGWTVDMWKSFRAEYDEEAHARGRVKVMGFQHKNKKADGRSVTREYLRYLAHHPATARTVARRLATKFVRDDPPADLVALLARTYLRHDTAIAPVLRQLVATRAFKHAVGAKVRDPGEDVVATYRVLGADLARPPAGAAGDRYAVNQLLYQVSGLGVSPFSWPRPDGQPIDNASWSSPARLIASMDVHQSVAAGWWPSDGVHYRKPEAWLPQQKVRFDHLVDDLSRRLLHRPASKRLVQACCQATGCKPHERITADHDLVKWSMYRLLQTLLDSPAHLTR
jgi:hypothetical protein